MKTLLIYQARHWSSKWLPLGSIAVATDTIYGWFQTISSLSALLCINQNGARFENQPHLNVKRSRCVAALCTACIRDMLFCQVNETHQCNIMYELPEMGATVGKRRGIRIALSKCRDATRVWWPDQTSIKEGTGSMCSICFPAKCSHDTLWPSIQNWL